MADGNIISAGTQVDLSGIRSLQSELAVLQERYRAVSSDIKQSVNRVVDAETQATEAIKAGHTQLAAVIQAAADSERGALDGLITKQVELKASLSELKNAVTSATTAEEQNAVATEAMAAAHAHAVTEIQAVSGTLRTLEGSGGLRAAERFLTLIPGLGSALQVAFPVIGIIALGEQLERVVEKFDKVSAAEKEAAKEAHKLNQEIQQIGREIERIDNKRFEDLFGKTAVDAKKAADETTRMADQLKIAMIQGQLAEQQSTLRTPVSRGVDATGGLAAANAYKAQAAALVEITRLEKELDKAQLEQVEHQKQSGELSLESLKSQVADSKKAAAEQKRGDAEERAEQRAQQAALKSGYDEMLSDKKSDHEVSRAEELAFRENELTELKQYGSKYLTLQREVSRQIGTLQQEVDREQDREAKEINKRLAENRLTSLQDEIRDIETHSKVVIEAEKRAAEEQKKAIAALRAETEAGGESGLADLEGKRGGIAQRKKLSDSGIGGSTPSQEIEFLKELKAIDAQIIAEKIATQAKLLQIDALNGDDAKVAADTKKLADIRKQGGLTMLNDTTSILQKEQAQYTKFFNQLNQEGVRAFNDLLTKGPKNFVADLNQLWTKMVLDFADKLLLMGLKWAENELLMVVVHTASQQAQVAATATAATQKQAINASTTIGELNADAVKAAAGAYAAVVGIPYIGPILAPPAAAVAYAGVLALGALGSFETGTNYVPKTGMYQLHAGEAVVPQRYNPAAGGQGGGDTFNVTQHITGGPQHSPAQIADMAASRLQGLMRRRNMTPA